MYHPLFTNICDKRILDLGFGNGKAALYFAQKNKVVAVENNLIDKSFNIGANFGLNKQGEIVLSDIGELWSNPENIKKQIEKRVWSYDYILRYLPSEKLREYFISKMDQIFL
jgi:tRNA1(Val) A37 N6-methylase TrmN6